LAERTQYGKYTVVAKIGQGAMGEVYEAQDSVLHRPVALKTIAASMESSPDARLRFHREAQSIARLNHPNIVTVYDFGEEGGVVYMAMELLDGSDVRSLIAAKHPMGLDERLGLIEQVCEGVGYAHSMSVIHRDLKPANIHVTSSGLVKVMDFGLARIGANSGMTATGAVLGTPHYMSPEQVRGERADPRSDVFALGAILYELLTGRPPFEAETMHAVLYRILETEPESVRRWNPDVPEPVVALAGEALAKDPARRFPTGSEMAAAVRAAREELSPGPSRESPLASLLDGSAPEKTQLIAPPTEGSLALEALVNSDAAASTPHVTQQGQPTLSGRARTSPGPGARSAVAGGRGRRVLVGAAAAIVAGAGGLLAWGLLGGAGEPPPAPAAVMNGSTIPDEQLLPAERKLAQESLQDRRYREAIDHAERALSVSAEDAEALRVREAAREALASAEAAASSARAALGKGDTAIAGRRLQELLEVQPGHPVVAELAGPLNDGFRPQAEQARAAMREAEANARRFGAVSGDALEGAGRLSREGAGAFARREYAVAAGKFLAARDQFARAGRAAPAGAPRAASSPATH
jgi:serine/threonine-protein kinase